ncbi:hypothetical protein AUTU_33100 [Aureibacter tunicatorum]|nr:hypothetical protein AUTU_33100 [Aureibacter tunicatorum]
MMFGTVSSILAQEIKVNDPFLQIEAGITDPLFTTYAASMERSRLYGDKAYKMVHYKLNEPIHYESDQAGRIANLWVVDQLVIDEVGKFYKKPVVKASFPDMMTMEYSPYPGIDVQETFLVKSSQVAIVDMQITNTSDKDHLVDLYPLFEMGNDSLHVKNFDKQSQAYITERNEGLWRLISGLYKGHGYPTDVREVFAGNFEPRTYGAIKGRVPDFYNTVKIDRYAEVQEAWLNHAEDVMVDFIAINKRIKLEAGDSENVRYIRGYQDQKEDLQELLAEVEIAKNEPLQPYIDANVELFAQTPRIDFETQDEKLVYLGSLNLARGCMLPPSGETAYNYYVFSRNPVWGWGHGHQVLHESISMIAYALMDPVSAQNSQRVYMEQQFDDGLIAYRHGPRGPQTYPHKGMPTTSAPFYSWINWNIYKVSQDKDFLQDAFDSGEKYVQWLIKNRDKDQDGTFEWGPYGIIENVRDWYNVVFQMSYERYLDVDSEDISDELECLDLSAMVAKEMKMLELMATELGNKKGSKKWKKAYDELAGLINTMMWDEDTEFYYNVDDQDHSFVYRGVKDLKRQEIIGFLPMWAGFASEERADKLVKQLTDPEKFWREYGIPTVAADDPGYSNVVDYCCKWNGPVWLLWNYMVYEGLRDYNYHDQADELAEIMMKAVTTQLSKNHNFWESFSPDHDVLDSPTNYIWDAIMAKVLQDYYEHKSATASSLD